MTVLGPGFSPFPKMMSLRPKETRWGLWVGVAPRYFTSHSPAFAVSVTRMCKSSNEMVFTAESAADAADATNRTNEEATNARNFIIPPFEVLELRHLTPDTRHAGEDCHVGLRQH